ncbi:hypothetical protein CRUP_019786, partial [Coryphaenoides rupestris]
MADTAGLCEPPAAAAVAVAAALRARRPPALGVNSERLSLDSAIECSATTIDTSTIAKMAEMEKEGRPPENKRSRKPAHPVKREINEEMKSFAENTMNELLGWYGYDKVELRDGEQADAGDHPQHVSVLKENSLPKVPVSMETSEAFPERAPDPRGAPASRNGVPEPSSNTTATASTSAPPGAKEHAGLPMMVPMIPPPHIQPPPDEDGSMLQIVCAWCQKVGVRRYSLSMGSELKSFCSEKCFAACRRAYFKRNK